MMIIRPGLLAAFLLLLSTSLLAEEFIESFHSDIEVRRNGDLQVTETIIVKAEGKMIRRGIFRDFPTRYTNAQGRDMVVGFEVLGVKRDASNEPYHIKNKGNGQRIYIGDENTYLSPGIYEYQLSYITTRQLGFFDDFDELYWNVTGTDWNFAINKASAMVTLPDTVTDFQLTGYTGTQGSTQQNLEHRRLGSNQVYFATNQPLKTREGLTIVAGWPKGLINPASAAQQRAWFLADNKPSLIIGGGAIALLIYYLLLWLRFGKDPESGVIVPRYQPPKGYSPASMRFIENMGYDKKCFTTAIINLAVKGAVEINDDDGNFKVIRQTTLTPSLAAGESQVLNGLFSGRRGNISITQSNHGILSKAIKKHKGSLKRDYEKKYFSTNSWLLAPGIIASIIVVASAILSLPSEDVIVKALFFGIFSMIPVILLVAAVRGIIRRGKRGLFQFAINVIILLVIGGMLINDGVPLGTFISLVPVPLVVGVPFMLGLHYFFYQLLKAPTLAGRRVLDKVEGFKHYLEVAEEDEIALTDAPTFTTDIYESYLPYAIALDLENEWTEKLNRAVTQGLVDNHYSQPRWYHSRGRHSSHFSTALSDSFSSAIASSSVAPGSSSGSSGGGSSGGGGGGGGGGGW